MQTQACRVRAGSDFLKKSNVASAICEKFAKQEWFTTHNEVVMTSHFHLCLREANVVAG